MFWPWDTARIQVWTAGRSITLADLVADHLWRNSSGKEIDHPAIYIMKFRWGNHGETMWNPFFLFFCFRFFFGMFTGVLTRSWSTIKGCCRRPRSWLTLSKAADWRDWKILEDIKMLMEFPSFPYLNWDVKIYRYIRYPPVIKHGNGTSALFNDFHMKNLYHKKVWVTWVIACSY